jgi:uncharacterized protein YebE (UPF0316 family)
VAVLGERKKERERRMPKKSLDETAVIVAAAPRRLFAAAVFRVVNTLQRQTKNGL